MNIFLFYSNLLLSIVATLLCVLQNIHMFQLNYYRSDTQFSWLFKNRAMLSANIFTLLLGGFALVMWDLSAFLMIIALVFAIKLNLPKKAKKPLVYTARIKRLLTCLVVIFAVIYTFSFFANEFSLLIIAGAFAFSPLIILLGNLINQPIEKAIQKHYIKDAEKMLKSHPNLKIIGITGSFGKTSMKYYLTTILNGKFNTLMTPESYNTPMGIVKTIRSELKATHEIFVCEMGAKWVGDIKEICDIVHPHHAIITSIGEQHLESFGSLSNIVKTKFELANALDKNSVLLLNGNSKPIMENLPSRNYELYGCDTNISNNSEAFDYIATNIRATVTGTIFDVKTPDEFAENLSTKLIGEHNAINLVGAIAMALKMGMSIEEIRPQLRKILGVPHRMQLLDKGDYTIIDDAYNSNPSGCKAALDALSLFDGFKILITPGMVELGSLQDSLNMEFGRQASKVCDYIILVGERQTEPIKKGLYDEDFPSNKLFVASSIYSALEHMRAINTQKRKIVLLENDLPDNY